MIFLCKMHVISTLARMIDFILFFKESCLLVECLLRASTFSLQSTYGDEAFLEGHQPRAHFLFSINLGHRNLILGILVLLSFPASGSCTSS